MKRLTEGLEFESVEVQQPGKEKQTMVPGEEFGVSFDKQSDAVEAIAAKMSGARVTMADIISESDPIVIPYTDK